MHNLQEKIQRKTATVAIIGLGYVGLPLAVLFARNDFKVMGIDREPEKIACLRQGKSYIRDVTDEQLTPLFNRGTMSVTSGDEDLAEADAIIVCVPTPLNKSRNPDVSIMHAALSTIADHLRPGQLVVLESTSYPGTTDEIALPLLMQSGYQVGEDFFLAYSPERVDPGNPIYTISNIPKLLAGITHNCTEMAALLYRQVVNRVVIVSSPRVAEMAKVLENTFRSVNIALINELALAAHQLGVDIWEVIEAAGTKPFGFMPFYPGPGVGGHCLPVDPLYLAWKARSLNFYPKLLELANQVNSEMPASMVDRITEILNRGPRGLEGAKVFILGVTYKRDVADIRESPALEIIRLLLAKGAVVSFHDPFIARLEISDHILVRTPLNEKELADQDCVVVVTDHTEYDYAWLVQHVKVLLDTRNATRHLGGDAKNVYRI